MPQEVPGLQGALEQWPCWLGQMLLWPLSEVGEMIHCAVTRMTVGSIRRTISAECCLCDSSVSHRHFVIIVIVIIPAQ